MSGVDSGDPNRGGCGRSGGSEGVGNCEQTIFGGALIAVISESY
jgi:hypothetical protein